MERLVCENGHGFSATAGFESCPYCDSKLTLKEYTPEDVEKTRVWYATPGRKKSSWFVEKVEGTK